MMTNDAMNFGRGDWIVHCHYGIGRIDAIEEKRIGDQHGTYFRINMADSVLWMSAEQMDNDQIRPIVSKTDFQEAVEALREPPKTMSSNLNKRQARIKRVTVANIPKETARLIRDLQARRKEKAGLNQGERRALRDLKKRFLQEWSVCIGLTMGEARRRLDRQFHWRRREVTRSRLETGRKETEKRQTSPFIEALARKDDKWSDWLNRQLVKGA